MSSYKTYRSRSKLKTALKILLIVLIVLAILAVFLFFYLRRYIVYYDTGLRLEIPFLMN